MFTQYVNNHPDHPLHSSLYWNQLSNAKMSELYEGFQGYDVLTDEEWANLSANEQDARPQVLVGVRSSICEGRTLTRASKLVMMEPLAIPAQEAQAHA